jgi:3-oxoacyl-[acyl-carrier protein] reductase
MSHSLKGKVAVVTGGSKGIGAEIAKAFAAEGASVVVNYASDKEGADRVVAAAVAVDGKAIAVQANVSKAADVARLFAETKRHFGALDILVNNAGVYQFNPLENVTESEFHHQFGTNVLGPILTTQEALKYFGPDGGSVINIGSLVSGKRISNSVVYTATKHALDGITSVLAGDLAPRKIRVNSINPGPVDTEGARTLGVVGGDFEKEFVAQTPLGRIGQPRDISRIAVFLASPDAAWLTGETIVAAGGLR